MPQQALEPSLGLIMLALHCFWNSATWQALHTCQLSASSSDGIAEQGAEKYAKTCDTRQGAFVDESVPALATFWQAFTQAAFCLYAAGVYMHRLQRALDTGSAAILCASIASPTNLLYGLRYGDNFDVGLLSHSPEPDSRNSNP